MSVQPLGDRVVVRVAESESVTASGLVIPETAGDRPQRGTVVAAGPGRYEDGKRVPMLVAEGDVVVFAKYGGTEVTVDGEDLLILRESDILAKVG
ncbi:MAG TPA: co-chaperone GroES [Miltoncostaeaceae bacterium]|nr:co-chaperone GroES [Miltoncostaeaceae bacterium]